MTQHSYLIYLVPSGIEEKPLYLKVRESLVANSANALTQYQMFITREEIFKEKVWLMRDISVKVLFGMQNLVS